jgi:hypothetical protein
MRSTGWVRAWVCAVLGCCLGMPAAAAPRLRVPSHELVHRPGRAPRLRVRQIRVTPQAARQKRCRNAFADIAAWSSATLVPIGRYRLPLDMERSWAAFFALLPPELHTVEAINDDGQVLVRPDLYRALRHPGRRESEYAVSTALHELLHSSSRQGGGSRRDAVMKQIRERSPEAAHTVHVYFEEAAVEVTTALLMTLRTGRLYWREHKLAYGQAPRQLAGYLLDKTGAPWAAVLELRRLLALTDPAKLMAEADAIRAFLASDRPRPRAALGKMAAELCRRAAPQPATPVEARCAAR